MKRVVKCQFEGHSHAAEFKAGTWWLCGEALRLISEQDKKDVEKITPSFVSLFVPFDPTKDRQDTRYGTTVKIDPTDLTGVAEFLIIEVEN